METIEKRTNYYSHQIGDEIQVYFSGDQDMIELDIKNFTSLTERKHPEVLFQKSHNMFVVPRYIAKIVDNWRYLI